MKIKHKAVMDKLETIAAILGPFALVVLCVAYAAAFVAPIIFEAKLKQMEKITKTETQSLEDYCNAHPCKYALTPCREDK